MLGDQHARIWFRVIMTAAPETRCDGELREPLRTMQRKRPKGSSQCRAAGSGRLVQQASTHNCTRYTQGSPKRISTVHSRGPRVRRVQMRLPISSSLLSRPTLCVSRERRRIAFASRARTARELDARVSSHCRVPLEIGPLVASSLCRVSVCHDPALCPARQR